MSASPASAAAPVPGHAWLGVMGGGQLGRMFVHAAQVHGFRVAVLEPDAASPAGAAADEHLRAPYLDAAALAALAQRQPGFRLMKRAFAKKPIRMYPFNPSSVLPKQ